MDGEPYDRVITQWNLADLALAEWEIAGGADMLTQALTLLETELKKFNEGLSEYQLNKCDELRAKIEVANRAA